MTATRLCLAALLVVVLSCSAAQAQCYVWPPSAPDACGPGSYCTNGCGLRYGPGYNLVPPYPPFQGMLAPPNPNNNGLSSPGFPTHPYARGPRDFYMFYDRAQDNPPPVFGGAAAYRSDFYMNSGRSQEIPRP
jgi:hypothetical protein